MSEALPEAAGEPEPIRLFSGRISAWLTPDDSMVFSLRVEGEEEDRRLKIPKALVRLAERQAGFDFDELVKAARQAG